MTQSEAYAQAVKEGKKKFTFRKTFGTIRNWRGKYAIVTDIEGKCYNVITRLDYAHPEFALKKAEEFVKAMYKDFTNFQGVALHFEFISMGEIQQTNR